MRTFTFTYGATTDRGDIRTENQDSVLTLTGTVKTQPTALMIIADGLGGLSYGAEVSRYIIEQFKRWWYEDFPSMIQEGMDTEEDIQELPSLFRDMLNGGRYGILIIRLLISEIKCSVGQVLHYLCCCYIKENIILKI